jgi:hypothetical protein
VDGKGGQDLVAVEHLPCLVAKNAPVAVAVMRHPEAGAALEHLADKGFRVLAPDAGVDVRTVGTVADQHELCAQRAEDGGTRDGRGSVRRVERDLPSLQGAGGKHPRGGSDVGGRDVLARRLLGYAALRRGAGRWQE